MDIIERFKNIISETEKPIVFEFGMCDGYHSNLMINILASSGNPFIYHGFEPVVELFMGINLSMANVDINSKIFIHNKAIGAEVGFVDFYKSDGCRIENGTVVDRYYGSSSIRKPKLVTQAWKDMTFTERKVESTTFDAHVAQYGLKGKIIDFVWADIQGAEVDLINGGKDTFRNVRYFYTEYANSEYYEGEIGLAEICEMLPYFQIVEDYGGDVLLINKSLI